MKNLSEGSFDAVFQDDNVFEFTQGLPLDNFSYWDIENPRKGWLDPKFCHMLGYRPWEVATGDGLPPNAVNSGDLENAVEGLRRYSLQPEGIYEHTVRYNHKMGKTVWIRGRAVAVMAEKGILPEILGEYTNITESKEAELTAGKELQYYEDIIDAADIGTWGLNLRTGECKLNERWATVFGYTLAELGTISRENWERYVHPDDLRQSDMKLQSHLDGKASQYESEVRLKHRLGHWAWVLVRGKITSRTPEGDPEWVTGSMQEITDKKMAFERNKLFIEQAPSAIAMFDRDICYLAASGKWLTDYNLIGTDIIGRSHYEVFPEIGEDWKKIHSECLDGATNTSDEAMFERADGGIQWISWDVRPWYLSDGGIGGIIMNTADITCLKEKDQEKRRVEEILDKTNEISRIGTWEVDLTTGKTKWGRVAKEIYEMPPNFEAGFSDMIGFYKEGESRQKLKAAVEEALRSGNPFDVEAEVVTANNKLAWLRTIGRAEFRNGVCKGLYGIFQDMTQQKVAGEKLRVSEEAFRRYFESAATGMAVLDRHWNWLEVNAAMCDMTGYTESELKNKTFQEMTHPDDLEADLSLRAGLVAGDIPSYQLEKRYFHKDGHVIYILLTVSLVRDGSGAPLYFISQKVDITQRVTAQIKQEEALANLEGILEGSSHVSIIGVDTNGLITQFNKGAENMLGYGREEVLFRHTPELLHLPEEVRARGKQLSELSGKKIDGFNVFIELAKREKFHRDEWAYVRKDGTVFPVLLTMTAIKTGDTVTGYLGVAADISEIKKAEGEIRSLLEITKGQNERLRDFAHIVSHNLRSHSGSFQMLLDLLVAERPSMAEDQLVMMLAMVSKNLGETIASLNEVVLMNSPLRENLVPVDFYDRAGSAIKNLAVIASEASVSLVNNIDPGTVVIALPAYIDSIILNLLTNGIKYRSAERESFVRLSVITEGEFLVIRSEDNGLGIDLGKYGSKIFGMYKTFHGNKDARGIGLFITKNQVEAMGGRIDVESEVGKGTTFKIYLKYEEV
jgi:PAS domain S-box-containing protein